jgi:oligo-1,6-glucosidase
VLHLLKGTPYVYQGEELGMTNTYFTEIGQYRDVEALNYHADAVSLGLEADAVLRSLSVKSRDNARTPMQWDDTSQAGFTSGLPWLTVNPNYVVINAVAAVADPGSVFHHYRELIALRHQNPAVVHGVFQLLLPEHEQVFAYTRTLEGTTLLVLANCSSSPVEVDSDALPNLTDALVLLGTHPGAEGLSLAPWESRIIQLAL